MSRWHKLAFALLGAAALTFVLLTLSNLSDQLVDAQQDARQNHGDAIQNANAVQRLAAQVRRLGGNPVVTPSQLPQPGPAGAKGDTGATGPQGPQGPQGPAGDAGKNGRDGKNGDPGQDGQPGPAGPAGPKGDTGAQGPAGPQGDQGPKGDTGEPGYPDSFTYTDPAGFTYLCTDPDGDHDYTCERQTP